MTISANIVNPQTMEIVVSGPDGANRLFIFSGTAQFSFSGWDRSAGIPVKETLAFLVGNPFSAGQVKRAIVVGGVSGFLGPGPNSADFDAVGVSVDSIDADWDDESGRIQVTAGLAVWGQNEFLNGLGFQVTVLATVA